MKAEKCPVCDRETKDGGIKVTVGGKGVVVCCDDYAKSPTGGALHRPGEAPCAIHPAPGRMTIVGRTLRRRLPSSRLGRWTRTTSG
jgi:hypothetical protein